MCAVRFQPIQPVGGAHVCKLLLLGGGEGRHSVPKWGGGGGGGGGGIMAPPAHSPGDAHGDHGHRPYIRGKVGLS